MWLDATILEAGVYSFNDLQSLGFVKNRTDLHRKQRRYGFPSPVKLGERAGRISARGSSWLGSRPRRRFAHDCRSPGSIKSRRLGGRRPERLGHQHPQPTCDQRIRQDRVGPHLRSRACPTNPKQPPPPTGPVSHACARPSMQPITRCGWTSAACGRSGAAVATSRRGAMARHGCWPSVQKRQGTGPSPSSAWRRSPAWRKSPRTATTKACFA